MQKGIFETVHPFTQLILTGLTMVVSGVLLTFVAMFFAPLLTGASMADIMTGKIDLAVYRYLQTVQGFTLFILPALALGFFFGRSPVRYFYFDRKSPKRWYLFVLFIVITAVPLINLMAALNAEITFPESLSWLESKLRAMEDAATSTTEMFLNVNSYGWLLFNVFMIAILPAVGEELIFRGVIQRIFIRWTGNIHWGIIIAGFVFSAFHFQFYGFFPRWALGVMLGYLFVWSGNIWLPIFAHFVNNFMSAVVAFYIYNGKIPGEVETFGSAASAIPVTIATTAVCFLLLWKIQLEARRQAREINPEQVTAQEIDITPVADKVFSEE